MAHRIAVIAGDGIGKEVMPEGLRVLDAAAGRFGIELDYEHFDWSCERYHELGAMMPDDALDTLRDFDAIYLGAVGFPGVPDHVSLWGLLIPIRRQFDQYVNLRNFSRRGCDRVMRFAFELAEQRNARRVTSATKSNGIIHTMPFWDERFAAMSAQYPHRDTDQYHIDILCAHFVNRPDHFDVVVASNLFGDILSDLGPGVTGTIAIAADAVG